MFGLAFLVADTTDFLTGKALGTFAGASTATVIVSNTVRYLRKKDVVWPAAVSGLAFSALQSSIVGANWSNVSTYLLILLNGALLFCTALGANQTLVSVTKPEQRSDVTAQGAKPVPWLSSWL